MELQILIKKIVSAKSYFLGSKIIILMLKTGINDKILAIFNCLRMLFKIANFFTNFKCLLDMQFFLLSPFFSVDIPLWHYFLFYLQIKIIISLTLVIEHKNMCDINVLE